MAKNNKQLNRLELELQKKIEVLMTDNEVKFSKFLPVLRSDMPKDKSSDEYKNKHKAEYLKQLRASYSVAEVVKMLEVLGYELKFKVNNSTITPLSYELNDKIKVKYTELMAVCEILGISIEWLRKSNRTAENASKI